MPKTDNSQSRIMLDAYFKFRSSLPAKDEDGRPYKKSFKTTEEIAADLGYHGGHRLLRHCHIYAAA